MSHALIGHTGFVGGNLAHQGRFDALFNSGNIETMRGQSFTSIWCAGVRAVKWWANQHPEEDRQSIVPLADVLATVRCEHFVLFSTVDVFARPLGVDEASTPPREGLHPYGLHRLQLEDLVRQRFASHTIIRLPGLFGKGLKKNIIYDFLHGNQVDKIHADSAFQFYDLGTVHADARRAVEAGLDLLHVAVEPVSVAEVARAGFGRDFSNAPEGQSPARYDLRTRHAGLYGHEGPYLQSRAEVLERLRAFVDAERRR